MAAPKITATAFRIPTALKKAASAKAKRVGIPLSFIVRNALASFAYEDKVIELNISDKEMRAIEKEARDVEMGKGIAFVAHTKADMHAYLNSLRHS